jgi:catechol 2,3-dioxygenase-like lactoylglutathione lyase family enzyme
VDHVGIRVADLARSLSFYKILGFELFHEDPNDAVAVIRNHRDVEINLVHNANDDNGGANILMDVEAKYPGHTHVALRVGSIKAAMETLAEHDIVITQGPVSFGDDGHVSLFLRDPDRNVIELRGRKEDLSSIGGVVEYIPQN